MYMVYRVIFYTICCNSRGQSSTRWLSMKMVSWQVVEIMAACGSGIGGVATASNNKIALSSLVVLTVKQVSTL